MLTKWVWKNGILLPKLFWPTVRKNCSTDRENFLKFEAEGREFAKILRSLEQFIWTVKGQNQTKFLYWVIDWVIVGCQLPDQRAAAIWPLWQPSIAQYKNFVWSEQYLVTECFFSIWQLFLLKMTMLGKDHYLGKKWNCFLTFQVSS